MSQKIKTKTKGISFFALALILVLLGYCPVAAQYKGFDFNDRKPTVKLGDTINEVLFSGNASIPDEELLTYISSKTNNNGLPVQTLVYYFHNSKKNLFTPPYIRKALEISLKNLGFRELVYDGVHISRDLGQILQVYNMYGFHQATDTFMVYKNRSTNKNILKFIINENKRWAVRSVKYLGLDGLPEEIKAMVNEINHLKPGNYFSEREVDNQNQAMLTVLHNNGYYFAASEQPRVTIDTADRTDSITINFRTGKRQRIQAVNFVDSLMGQAVVATGMKKAQLTFTTGEWYNLSAIKQSEMNLRSLGTFDVVRIDTSSSFYTPTDTTLPIVIFLKYCKQKEWGVYPGFSHSAYGEKDYQLGAEFSVLHRNFLTSAAMSMNIFGNFNMLDLAGWVKSPRKREWELQTGINAAQSFWDNIYMFRFGWSGQLLYSYRTISDLFNLSTASLAIRIPFRIAGNDNIMGDLNFTVERQTPENFDTTEINRKLPGLNAYERQSYYQSLRLYNNINIYVRDKSPLITALILGGNIMYDTRDSKFAPSRGVVFSAGAESGLSAGIARYDKIQLSYNKYWQTLPFMITALKAFKIGNIWWHDPGVSYVPFERQYFAGGSNSVRGWAARQLRFSNDTAYASLPQEYRDITGSGFLIEGSLELRFRFSMSQPGLPSRSSWLSDIGGVAFIDWGNAFHKLAPESNGNFIAPPKLIDYINPGNWGWAAGFGFRYESPYMPFRLDFGFPVYDPMRKDEKYIFQQKNFLSHMQLHIAVGQAF